MIKARKDLNLKNVSIDVALGKILEGSGFVYSKVDGVYMVKRASEQKDAQAKPRVFTGEVVDVNGEPLPGVTVVVKGTTLEGRRMWMENLSCRLPWKERLPWYFRSWVWKARKLW